MAIQHAAVALIKHAPPGKSANWFTLPTGKEPVNTPNEREMKDAAIVDCSANIIDPNELEMSPLIAATFLQ